MQSEPEKELIHLLPIKDKGGIIPQTMEKPGRTQILNWYSSQDGYNLFFLNSTVFVTCLTHSVFAVSNVAQDEEEDTEEMEEAEGNKTSCLPFLFFGGFLFPNH